MQKLLSARLAWNLEKNNAKTAIRLKTGPTQGSVMALTHTWASLSEEYPAYRQRPIVSRHPDIRTRFLGKGGVEKRERGGRREEGEKRKEEKREGERRDA